MLNLVYRLDLFTLAALHFVMMVAAKEIGHAIALRAVRKVPARDDAKSGVGFAVSGMLGLMAFTLGLTISMAQGRYDARRDLVLSEANAIGTVYLRAQLIGGAHGAAIMQVLPDYTRLRISYVDDAADAAQISAVHARVAALQQQMWSAATEIARSDPGPIPALLLQALNEMFDLSLSLRVAFESRVPLTIVRLLLVASLISVGGMGYYFGLAGVRHRVVSTLLILLWVLSFVLIIDLDQPRRGTIQVEPSALRWTLEGFGPAPPAR